MSESSVNNSNGLFADIPDLFQQEPALFEICGTPERSELQRGLSNRVFRLEAEKGVFFLRLPEAGSTGGIDRNTEARNLAQAATLGLGVPPLFCRPETGILLTAAIQDLIQHGGPDFPRALGEALGKLHGSRCAFAGRLDPAEVYTAQSTALQGNAALRQEVDDLDRAFKALQESGRSRTQTRLVPSHGDLSPGNCLLTRDRLWLIDWEFSAMAEPAWDIAYAIQENGFCETREAMFLEGYRAAGAAGLCPDPGRLNIMKAKCDAVSALWALEQVAKGRARQSFLAFARERKNRALDRLKGLIPESDPAS